MTIPLRQLAFWNLCQGPGAFFLTLAIRKPCLRPPARCTTSKDLAKASEFWSILTGLKIFEMIRAGATVKTYIEDHWRLGLNTSRNSSESLNTSGQILWPRFRFRQMLPLWTCIDNLESLALHCTTLYALFCTPRLLAICSEKTGWLSWTNPDSVLNQTRPSGNWLWLSHTLKTAERCAGPPWTARRSSLLLLHPGLIARENIEYGAKMCSNELKWSKPRYT